MFDSICNFLKGRKKEKGSSILEEPMDYLGVSYLDLVTQIDDSRKKMKKNIDEIIKQLPNKTDDELVVMRNDIKEKRKHKFHFQKYIKDQFPHDKIGFAMTEMQRLFEAIDEELEKRKSKK